jgi:hypothetical protein
MSVTISRCALRVHLQLFVGGVMSYSRYLCLLAHSGVQHIVCCVFVLYVFVLCTLGVYIYQFIPDSTACSSYQGLIDRGLLLARKLLNQGFLLVKMKALLEMLYGPHHNLVNHYGILWPWISSVHHGQNLVQLSSFMTYHRFLKSKTTCTASGAGTTHLGGFFVELMLISLFFCVVFWVSVLVLCSFHLVFISSVLRF